MEISNIVNILLVEDNPGDAGLIRETLGESKMLVNLYHVSDGFEAMEYLDKTGRHTASVLPDLILLDLNLPKKSGLEVLSEMKENEKFKHIPVIIMTVSQSEEDIMKSYRNHANCFITKPIDFNRFINVVQAIEDFWFTIVKLPRK